MLDASIGERAAALGEARCQVHPIGLCFLSSCLLLFFFFLIFFFLGMGSTEREVGNGRNFSFGWDRFDVFGDEGKAMGFGLGNGSKEMDDE